MPSPHVGGTLCGHHPRAAPGARRGAQGPPLFHRRQEFTWAQGQRRGPCDGGRPRAPAHPAARRPLAAAPVGPPALALPRAATVPVRTAEYAHFPCMPLRPADLRGTASSEGPQAALQAERAGGATAAFAFISCNSSEQQGRFISQRWLAVPSLPRGLACPRTRRKPRGAGCQPRIFGPGGPWPSLAGCLWLPVSPRRA